MRSHSDGALRRFTRLGRSAPAAVPGRAAEPNYVCETIGSEPLLQRIRSKGVPAYLASSSARVRRWRLRKVASRIRRTRSAFAARPSAPAGSRYST